MGSFLALVRIDNVDAYGEAWDGREVVPACKGGGAASDKGWVQRVVDGGPSSGSGQGTG